MKKKKHLIMLCSLLFLVAAGLFFSIPCRADNTGEYFFDITHPSTCNCNSTSALHTVVLGSTHTYTISPHASITFASAVWNVQSDGNSLSSSVKDGGKNIIITFNNVGKFTISATMKDTSGNEYHTSIPITVVEQHFEDAYLTVCGKTGNPISIAPQFKMFSKEHPYGILADYSENVDWNMNEIANMSPSKTNNKLYFTPTKSGEYNIYALLSTNKGTVQTKYTILVADREISPGQVVTTSGQKYEYIIFKPNVSGRYKFRWIAGNRGYESIYDTDGKQIFSVDDVIGGYILSADENYFIKLNYNTPSSNGSYTIELYRTKLDLPSNPVFPGTSSSQTNVAQGNNAASSSPAVTVQKAKGKPTLKNKKGKKLKVSFKKVTGADGYEIRYATNKKFKKSKKVFVSSAKGTLKKLKKGKKYFVKIRAYKLNAASEKVFGSYGKTATIVIKK